MKKLLIFTIWQVGDEIDLTPGSNQWYVRRYESYFDDVCHLYLLGRRTQKVVKNGRSRYVSVGSDNSKLDFLLAPYRLYKFASQYKPAAYLTVEQIWLFWVVAIVKVMLRAKVFLLPITYPEAMYKLTGRSLSGRLPIWLERKLIAISYRVADKVVTSENLGSYINWISANRILSRKLIIAKSIPEAVPTQVFFDAIAKANEDRPAERSDGTFRLIYVGRLHVEKSADDLIRMMNVLKEHRVDAHLTLVGDGSERATLQELANELNVADRIDFLGWKTNHQLPAYLMASDVFVSPSTGCSLREAALCGVPVVAYEMDWIRGLLEDQKTFLAVAPNDWFDMANKVEILKSDAALQKRLSDEIKALGWRLWSGKNMRASLRDVFD